MKYIWTSYSIPVDVRSQSWWGFGVNLLVFFLFVYWLPPRTLVTIYEGTSRLEYLCATEKYIRYPTHINPQWYFAITRTPWLWHPAMLPLYYFWGNNQHNIISPLSSPPGLLWDTKDIRSLLKREYLHIITLNSGVSDFKTGKYYQV
jgi:hypothetical protein